MDFCVKILGRTNDVSKLTQFAAKEVLEVKSQAPGGRQHGSESMYYTRSQDLRMFPCSAVVTQIRAGQGNRVQRHQFVKGQIWDSNSALSLSSSGG